MFVVGGLIDVRLMGATIMSVGWNWMSRKRGVARALEFVRFRRQHDCLVVLNNDMWLAKDCVSGANSH